MDITSEANADDSASACDLTRNQLNIRAENFRPNLLVSGSINRPHQEDLWSSITVPGFVRSSKESGLLIPVPDTRGCELTVSGPCPRCSMVNVNSTSGAMDCRAFQALSSYRKQERNVYFGQFLTQHGSSSDDVVYITVGSVVSVHDSTTSA